MHIENAHFRVQHVLWVISGFSKYFQVTNVQHNFITVYVCVYGNYYLLQEIFSDDKIRDWFGNSGRQMLTDLLLWADRVGWSFQQDYS